MTTQELSSALQDCAILEDAARIITNHFAQADGEQAARLLIEISQTANADTLGLAILPALHARLMVDDELFEALCRTVAANRIPRLPKISLARLPGSHCAGQGRTRSHVQRITYPLSV